MQCLHRGFGCEHGNIRWNHIRHKADRESRDIVAAKIIDYAGWEGEYFTFVSKGAFQALKEWIDYRELSGEITDGNSRLSATCGIQALCKERDWQQRQIRYIHRNKETD